MRLTLRTLLAWRDGTLSPSDRADISTKVADSPTAQTLSSRIDRSLADDSLPPPQAVAAGEPNAVAEYLDNVLPGAALDSFELACVQSEALLGEVGASHRILAELSLDPRLLPTLGPAELARLLARLESAKLAVADSLQPPPGSETDAEAAADAAEIVAIGADSGAEQTAAGRRRRSSLSAWLMAAAALVLLAVASGVLAWSVGSGRLVASRLPPRAADQPAGAAGQPERADRRPGAIAEPSAVNPPAAVASLDQSAAPGQSPTAPDAAQNIPTAPVAPPAPMPSSPPAATAAAPATAPQAPTAAAAAAAAATIATANAAGPAEPPAPATPVPATTVPFGDALAIAAAPAGAPKPATPAAPAPAPAPAAAAAPPPPPDGVLVVGDEVLLATPATGEEAAPDRWQVVRGGDRPELPIRLLAPAWCRPAFEIDQARLVLAAGTLLSIDRDAAGVLRLTLENGAVAAAGVPGPTDLRLQAEGIDGIVTVTAGAALGFEVQRGVSPGIDARPETVATLVRVHATAAPVPWRPAGGRPEDADAIPADAIPARSTLTWTSADPAATEVAARDHTPGWLATSEPRDAFERGVRAALAASLKSGDPAEPALLRMTAERRVERRIAASATLAQLGNYGPLTALLVDDSPRGRLREEEWNRLERAAVPAALARGPVEADAFARALAAAAPAGTGPLLVSLAEAAGPGEPEADPRPHLLDALESPWLVVRRFAWRTLLAVDPPGAVDRIRYRPERPADLNAAGVRWWRERVAKPGLGLAQPAPAEEGAAKRAPPPGPRPQPDIVR